MIRSPMLNINWMADRVLFLVGFFAILFSSSQLMFNEFPMIFNACIVSFCIWLKNGTPPADPSRKKSGSRVTAFVKRLKFAQQSFLRSKTFYMAWPAKQYRGIYGV